MKVEDLRIGMTVAIVSPPLHGKARESIPMQVVSIFKDGDVYLDFDGNEGDIWEVKAKDLKLISESPKVAKQFQRKAVKAYCKACDIGKDIICKHDGDCAVAAEFLNELNKW